jgi:hypothetical protein
VTVDADDAALDACLAALDAHTPAATRVWLADDAAAGPRGLALIQRWLAATPLTAWHSRRTRRLGDAAHLAEALAACGDDDVIVLAGDAVATPGWYAALQASLARDAAIASATSWCNAGETAAWPRCGEIAPMPDAIEAAAIAHAAVQLPAGDPPLPHALGHAVAVSGRWRTRVGTLDGASFGSACAALADWSLRAEAFGARNVLAAHAYVARPVESQPADGDTDLLDARWPQWRARSAAFLMHDPLASLRRALGALRAGAAPQSPQADLFG